MKEHNLVVYLSLRTVVVNITTDKITTVTTANKITKDKITTVTKITIDNITIVTNITNDKITTVTKL